MVGSRENRNLSPLPAANLVYLEFSPLFLYLSFFPGRILQSSSTWGSGSAFSCPSKKTMVFIK